MRKLWICCIATLVVLGCKKSDTEVNSKLPEAKAISEVVSQVATEEKKMDKERTGGPAGASNIEDMRERAMDYLGWDEETRKIYS